MTNLFILKPEGKTTNSRRLRVFYGWSKLNSVRKRKAKSVIFENARQSEARSLNFIRRFIYVIKPNLKHSTDSIVTVCLRSIQFLWTPSPSTDHLMQL